MLNGTSFLNTRRSGSVGGGGVTEEHEADIPFFV